MRTVRWNKLARLDYYQNISYLLQNWSKKEAQNFIDKVWDIENLLAKENIDFQKILIMRISNAVQLANIFLYFIALPNPTTLNSSVSGTITKI